MEMPTSIENTINAIKLSFVNILLKLLTLIVFIVLSRILSSSLTISVSFVESICNILLLSSISRDDEPETLHVVSAYVRVHRTSRARVAISFRPALPPISEQPRRQLEPQSESVPKREAGYVLLPERQTGQRNRRERNLRSRPRQLRRLLRLPRQLSRRRSSGTTQTPLHEI